MFKLKLLDWIRGLAVSLIAMTAITGFSATSTRQAAEADAIKLAVDWLMSYSEGDLDEWQVLDSSSDIPLAPPVTARVPSGDQIQPPSGTTVGGATVVSLYGWTDEMGILARWEVTVHEGEVVFVHGEVVGVAAGNANGSLTEGPFLPTPGKLIKHEAVPNSVVPQQVAGPHVNVSNHWVEIYDEPDRTQSTRISIEGFGADQDVQIAVQVDGVNVQDVSGDPLVIHTDDQGVGSTVLTPAQNSRTGRASVLAVSPSAIALLEITDPTSSEGCPNSDIFPDDDERGGLTLERVLEAQANAAGGSMTFLLHYIEQAIDV